MESAATKEIKEQLCHILRIDRLDAGFGEPFIKAFSEFMPDEEEKVLVASFTCSIFLSAILYKFPTEKLHTFVHFTKEHYQRFSFNCKMYDSIFSHMEECDLENVALLDREGKHTNRHCTKQEIFEAFDFYTNG